MNVISNNRLVRLEDCHPCSWMCSVCGTPIVLDADIHDPKIAGMENPVCCGKPALVRGYAEPRVECATGVER